MRSDMAMKRKNTLKWEITDTTKEGSFLRKNLLFALSTSVIFLLLVTPACAMRNPAAVYCSALGYEYVIETTARGDWGNCILPTGEKVDEWQFLKGKTGTSYSYCSKQGLPIKTIRDPDRCILFLTDECSVCVLANGTEVEVTELMGLSFNETTCGDRTCGMPENYKTCPQDCPSGSEDDYCDGVSDKICDLDCGSGRDPDCNPEEMASPVTPSVTMTQPPILGEFPLIWDIGIGFLIVIIICGVYLFVKKLRKI